MKKNQNWENRYEELKNYLAKNKKLPHKDSEPRLFNWISSVRRHNKLRQLETSQIKMMEKLKGWIWVPNKTHAKPWEENYRNLVAYIKKHKTYPSSRQDYLGRWVDNQRASYKKNLMTSEKIQLLERVPNWTWEVDQDFHYSKLWAEKYNQLVDYLKSKKEYPTYRNNSKLYNWMFQQKFLYSKGKLNYERASLLERLKGWVWRTYNK